MRYIALSPDQLKRLRHHRWKGLGLSDEKDDALYQAALALQDNPKLRERLEHKLLQVLQKPGVIRFILWLTNWNQYRSNFYHMHAYWSLQFHQRGLNMFSGNGHEGTSKGSTVRQIFWLTAASGSAVFGALWPYVKTSSTWFGDQATYYLGYDGANIPHLDDMQPQPSVPNEGEQLKVVEEIMPSLAILGINKKANELISFNEIKKAYYQLCLLTHPDKTQKDTKAAFIKVDDAFKIIFEYVSNGSSPHRTANNEQLARQMANLAKQMDELFRGWQEASKTWKGLGEDFTKLRADYQDIRAKLARQHDELQSMDADLQRLKRDMLKESEGMALPSVTKEEVEGCLKDPDYYLKKSFFKETGIEPDFLTPAEWIRLKKQMGKLPMTEEEKEAFDADPEYFYRLKQRYDALQQSKNSPVRHVGFFSFSTEQAANIGSSAQHRALSLAP